MMIVNNQQIRDGMRAELRKRVDQVMREEADILNQSVRTRITDKVTESLCGFLADLFGPLT